MILKSILIIISIIIGVAYLALRFMVDGALLISGITPNVKVKEFPFTINISELVPLVAALAIIT
jgi:hypothetical protein